MLDTNLYWIGLQFSTGNIVFPPQNNNKTESKLPAERIGKLLMNERLEGWLMVRGLLPVSGWDSLSAVEKEMIEIQFKNPNVKFISYMNFKGDSFTITREDFVNPNKPKAEEYIDSPVRVDDTELDAAVDFYNTKQ